MSSIFVDVSLFCSASSKIAITCLTALNVDASTRWWPRYPFNQTGNHLKYVLYVFGGEGDTVITAPNGLAVV